MQADEGTSTEQDAAAEEGRSAPAKKSMMTQILAIAISSVIAVFFAYSLYGDFHQKGLISRDVADKLRSSGSLAADSLGNWLQARLKLTELAADGIAAGDASPAAASFELSRKTLLTHLMLRISVIFTDVLPSSHRGKICLQPTIRGNVLGISKPNKQSLRLLRLRINQQTAMI